LLVKPSDSRGEITCRLLVHFIGSYLTLRWPREQDRNPSILMSACNWASRNSDSWKLLLNPCNEKRKALCFFRRVFALRSDGFAKIGFAHSRLIPTAKLLRESGLRSAFRHCRDLWLGGTETTNFAKFSALALFAVNTFPDEISALTLVAT